MKLIIGTLAFVILGIAAYRLAPKPVEPPPVYGEIGNFELVDQEGAPFSQEKIKGSVTVVNFIFSSCPGVCPLLTQQMAKVQEHVKEKQLSSKLVSISVDPERDNPETLKAYAGKYGADFERWSFLTGELNTIRTVVIESFKTMIGQEKSQSNPDLFEIVHGENFVILDRESRIRAFQKVKTPEDLKALLRMVELLEKGGVS